MSPFRKIEEAYEKAGHVDPFLYFLKLYAEHGFVFCRPDVFIMGRPVPKDAPKERIIDDQEWFHGEEKNCWYIAAAAGNTARMWQVVPFELPWFCWTRLRETEDAELTFVTRERLCRLCPPDLTNGLQPVLNR